MLKKPHVLRQYIKSSTSLNNSLKLLIKTKKKKKICFYIYKLIILKKILILLSTKMSWVFNIRYIPKNYFNTQSRS